MDLDNPYAKRIIEACKKLKLKPVSPCYLEDVACHVGIPHLKVSFFLRHVLETAKVLEMRKRWEKHGWLNIAVSHRQLEPLTDEQLVAHLESGLVELGKLRR
jgi:hypothetical protein